LVVCFLRSGDVLTKIGQYPSRATLDFGNLGRAFQEELEPTLRKQLGTAIGLRAHGVGIGSFAYLRRIVEHLLEEAHVRAAAAEGWDEDVYQRSRVEERIALLKGSLPSRMVRSAKTYAILSKGLHELEEDECLEHFDLLMTTIGLILSQRLEEREFDDAEKQVRKSHARLARKGTRHRGNGT
jgi:hypothetical protein